MKKYAVGVVGATGMVGQRFVSLLENHPWFQLTVVAASSRSAGKTYQEAVGTRWAMPTPMPEEAKSLVVLDAQADKEKIAGSVDFIFCAVDMKKDEIRALEESYAKLECPVISNNSAHRWTPDVPMVIPEVNPEHIQVIQEDETVTLRMDVKTLKGLGDIKIYITSRRLSALEFNGAVDFECKNGLRAKGDFSLSANGAADVEIDALKADKVNIVCNGAADVDIEELKSDEITVVVNGAADVSLAGRTGLADLTINGVGGIDIARLEADKVLSSVHGLGSISRKKDN